jgi:peptidoglycan LD-endopeptidase CwlK
LRVLPFGLIASLLVAAASAVAQEWTVRADIYARVPAIDDRGRDQHAMFRLWNPDPVGRHEANLKALNPVLASVVRRVQADNPELRFVIGSGRRSAALQRQAVAWGWSRTPSSAHETGDAVDLWPLDEQGRVHFDPVAQNRVGAAMKLAAVRLGVRLRWGGNFQSYGNRDRSHFELAP